MADASAFLQGSQTGGILQGLQQSAASYIPAISGTQAQQYTPGYGQAPYAAQQPAGQQQAVQGAISGVNGAYGNVYSNNAFMQNMLAQTQANAAAQQSSIPNYLQGANSISATGNPSVNTYPGQSSANTGSVLSSTPAISNNGITTIGQSNGWMSPDQLAASNNGLQTMSSGFGQSGGSIGGGSNSSSYGTSGQTTAQQQAAQGLQNLNPVQGPSVPGPNNLGPYQTGSMLSYQNPQQVDTSGQMNPVSMQNADPNSSLGQFNNSLANQVLNGQNAYQQSPGYQFAVQQAMQNANQQAASQGLLGSGALQKAEINQATGMALQDYSNWWNRQSGLVSNYENQLAGLAGGQTGGAQAYNLGQTLAGNTSQTGGNVAGLLGNQGNTGIGGMVNTSAAQANDIMHAGNTQAQINSTNSATQLAGATSGIF